MPESRIIINTTPILALIAGFGSVEIIGKLYREVVVPFEVAQEISHGQKKFGFTEFTNAICLTLIPTPVKCSPVLQNMLDPGEASVIQTALNSGFSTVCIDEKVGRRVARLHGLLVTGSLGILLRAKKENHLKLVAPVIQNMIKNGIWLSHEVQNEVLRLADE